MVACCDIIVFLFFPESVGSDGLGSKGGNCDVSIVNLALVRDLKVRRECNDPPPPLENLNTSRVS